MDETVIQEVGRCCGTAFIIVGRGFMDRRRALTRSQLMQRIGQPILVIDMWSGRRWTQTFNGDLRGYHISWIAFDT